MGDLDAKRLLIENSKLKLQQNELSNDLGEEREMVKYLHGVIKNYEQLLRSNSKSMSSQRPTVAKRYHTDLRTDLQLTKPREDRRQTKIESTPMKSRILTTQNRKGDLSRRSMPLLSEQRRNKTPLSLQKRLIKGNEKDNRGIPQNQEVNKLHIGRENVSRSSSDLCLEDLESSSSSDEDLSKDNLGSFFNSHNIGHQKESRDCKEPMGSVVKTSLSRLAHEYNKESHTGRHQETINSTSYQNWYCPKATYDKNGSNKEGTSSPIPSISTTFQATSINKDFNEELTEMFRELDKMESKLDKYEKSVAKSEKRLTKLENKLEYLESFALGEESECL